RGCEIVGVQRIRGRGNRYPCGPGRGGCEDLDVDVLVPAVALDLECVRVARGHAREVVFDGQTAVNRRTVSQVEAIEGRSCALVRIEGIRTDDRERRAVPFEGS